MNNLNGEILKELNRQCGNDKKLLDFLTNILFFEADRAKNGRYNAKYREFLEKYSVDWSGNNED